MTGLLSLCAPLLLGALSPASATTREAALDAAAAYATHRWTATSANTTADCDADYESDYGAGTFQGLPYDWGGYVTLSEFDAQIADGYGAGGHSWDGVLWCTTGVDCSGYLSEVWGSGHYGTSTFSSVTHEIDWSDLAPADAINDAGSHIVLFTHLSEGGWPVFYEAAGGASKVRMNSSGGWTYVDGYQPIRFDDIEESTTTGTLADPIEITAFPYQDDRWTAGAASDLIDVYACKPTADESGPERLYRFTAATAGTLTAVVSDMDEVDIDVHVLSAPDGESCLGRDDTEVTVEVGPGEVWLSLDSYVGSREFPGPYTLTVSFTGTVGEPPEGDGDTGSSGGDGGGDGDDGGSTTGDTGSELEDEPQIRLDEPRPRVIGDGDSDGKGGCATAPGRGLGLALAAWLGLLGLRVGSRRRSGRP